MGSDDVSAAGGFRFNAAAAVPRAMGSAVFAKSKVSKRRGLNRWGSGQDQWEFTGVNPFVAAIGRGGSRGLGDGKLNVDLGIGDSVRLDLSGIGGGDVGARIGGDGSEFCGRNLEKEFPGELKKLNIYVGGKVESGVAAGKLGGRAVITSELPEHLRKLNSEDGTSLANESGITDSNFHAVDQSIVFESVGIKDGNPSSMRMDTELSDDVENKLKIGDRSKVSFTKVLPLESSSQEEVTSECVDDNQNRATETVADSASSGAAVKDGAFSSSCGTQLEENGSFTFIGKQSHVVMPFAEFTTPSSKVTFVFSANEKIEFAAKRETSDFSRIKKKKGKFKPSAHVHSYLMQDLGSNLDSSSGKQEESDSYSPMDVSTYQQMLGEDGCSTQTSVISNDPNILDKDHVSDVSHPSCVKDNSKDNFDEELVFATHRMHIYGNGENEETDKDVSLDNCNRNVDTGGLVEECVTGAETESFKSAIEEVKFFLDDAMSLSQRSQASSSYFIETENDRKKEAHNPAPRAEGTRGSSFTFTASSSHQGQSSMIRWKTKKKPLTDAGCGSFKLGSCSEDSFTSARSYLSSELQSVTSHSLESANQLTYLSESGRQVSSSSVKGRGIKLGSESISATTLASQEACEKWRLRGNQAYTSGDASKAEECYSQGIDSIQKDMVSRSCIRALMLCYSNRAAMRMSLGRLSDAIQDCMMAISLDPNFFKAQVRAANCFLSLGKINDALHYYKRCLQPGNDTCADRKITVEASEGSQKAQKVSECINRSAELLTRKTTKDVEGALEIIDEALLISPFSERLLQMKAEALFVLRKYEEVIQLCEDTLDSAEKNSSSASATSLTNNEHGLESSRLKFKLWRCSLMFKSYFQLGRLEQGVASIERNEISNLGAVQPLVETARELLRLKTAGNEAFRAGRYAEAVENYTAALSCKVQSSPFAAICFCYRAAAYKASGQILDAIADYSLVIALSGNDIKAISRRASLFEMIRDYEQAAADLQRLISALTKQVGENTDQGGANDSLLSCSAELKQTHRKLAELEEEARMDIPHDMYLILGVESSASMSEIKKAYRKAALRHHPDKATQFISRNENGDDKIWKEIAEEVNKDADRLFKMIGVAYAILSDPVKRSQHDAEEELRKAEKNHAAASTSRAYRGASNPPPFERSMRQPHTEVWRYHNSQQAHGPELSSWTRYS